MRTPAELRGKRAVVFGLGTKGGGTEVVKWLVKHGADVLVTEKKTAQDLRLSLEGLRGLPVRYSLGGHRAEDFVDADLIVRNPAVPLDSLFLARAADRGIPVVMDTTLFFQFCPAPIAGITGTRGKSTATAVAGEILRQSRPETVVAGNIERSPLADLDRITKATPVVLELSSWQLEGIEPLARSPHWAVLTTILPDHLNRYTSLEAYVAAKETIVKHQTADDVAILPLDDEWGARFARLTRARTTWFGDLDRSEAIISTADGVEKQGLGISRFELSESVRTALVLRGGQAVLYRGSDYDGQETLLASGEFSVLGEHTRRNMLAGALLALEMGASLEDVRAVLRTFRGLPNRLAVIREYAGRTFVNDTTATTPEAVMAALDAFRTRPVVLMTGGTDKNLDYRGLASFLHEAENLRAVVLLAGSATENLLVEIRKRQSVRTAVPLSAEPVSTMREAVRLAWKAAHPGDVILLSPGAASFEFFRDEFDRGQQFRDAVARVQS